MIRTTELKAKTKDGPLRQWVEVWAPTSEELSELAKRFGLHELAMEDVLRPGHPPKYETFDDHLFAIVHTPTPDLDEPGSIKVALFLSAEWVVTAVRRNVPELQSMFKRVAKEVGARGLAPAQVFYMVMDALTDGFNAEVDGLDDKLDALEQELALPNAQTFMRHALDVRRQLSDMLRIVRDQRDVARSVEMAVHPALPERLRPYFRDVHDHLVRVHGRLEASRDLLGGIRDAYFSAADHRLNQVMRVLTVIATIMMPLSLVAGLYGMNVATIPGSESQASFWWIVGGMALSSLGMLWVFRRKGWI